MIRGITHQAFFCVLSLFVINSLDFAQENLKVEQCKGFFAQLCTFKRRTVSHCIDGNIFKKIDRKLTEIRMTSIIDVMITLIFTTVRIHETSVIDSLGKPEENWHFYDRICLYAGK